MKAGKVLGVILLVLGGLTLFAGLLAVLLPLIPIKAVQEALNAIQSHSDEVAGTAVLWLVSNGLLVLAAGAGMLALGSILLAVCARIIRNRARREAEEKRNSLMEQKGRMENGLAAYDQPQNRRAASADALPLPAVRREEYVSPVSAVRPNPIAYQQQTTNPLARQMTNLRSSLHEQCMPAMAEENVGNNTFREIKEPLLAERTGGNPYVRPLFTLSEGEATERIPEQPRNPYARPQTMTAPDINGREAPDKTIPTRGSTDPSAKQPAYEVTENTGAVNLSYNREREAFSQDSSLQKMPRLYIEHVAAQQPEKSFPADSLMQRMGTVLPGLSKHETAMPVELPDYIETHHPEWNHPADLTVAQAWNTSDMPVQTLWDSHSLLSSEKDGEPSAEYQIEAIAEDVMPETQTGVLLPEERASEGSLAGGEAAVRTRMGRRAVLEKQERLAEMQRDPVEQMPLSDEQSGAEEHGSLLSPASSRIRLTVGKHTPDV